MSNFIKEDLYRYGGLTSMFQGFKIPGFAYMYFWRKAKHSNQMLSLFYKIILWFLKYRFSFQIPLATQIGKGLFIGHFGHIVINRSIIGNYCNLAHGITLGQTNKGSKKGAPILNDYVWVGTGAVLVGKISIGKNVLIAPNAYVNFDKPKNSIVIGNPGKIISKENATEGYINNILNA